MHACVHTHSKLSLPVPAANLLIFMTRHAILKLQFWPVEPMERHGSISWQGGLLFLPKAPDENLLNLLFGFGQFTVFSNSFT